MTWRLCAFVVLAVGVLGPLTGCGGHGEGSATSKADGVIQPVAVTIAPIEHRSVMRTVDVVGTLHGWEDVTIGVKTDGRVAKVLHDMGDRVEPGALLVRLETEEADLMIEQAERQFHAELAKLGLQELPSGTFDVSSLPAVVQAAVALDRTRQNLARERSLMQRNAGAMQDYQNAENDGRSAEAALANATLTAQATLAGARTLRVAIDIARHRRADLEVRAPIPSGLPEGETGAITYAISRRHVSEGQMLKQGDAIVELIIENPLRLWARVPERNSDDVKVGQPVGLTIASHPGTIFEGKVARINPKVDDTSRTFQVEAVVPNKRGLLRPGGFAKASIVTSMNSEALAVPIESVSSFAGVTKIFVVDGGKAHAVPVETGLQGKGWVEVSGALPSEVQVVTTGLVRLAEGTPVVVRTTEDSPGAKETAGRAKNREDAADPVARVDEHTPRNE